MWMCGAADVWIFKREKYGVSIHTAGRMHSIGESMHTAGFGMIFYLLIYLLLLYNCFRLMDFDGYGFLPRDAYA